MTPTTYKALTVTLVSSAIAAALMAAALIADLVTAHDPAPAPVTTTATVTVTTTTPVAPCDDPDCPPWPSLDQGDNDD